MKFLVLGCNGMAGHMIALYLHERGHNVIGFARKPSTNVPTIVGDAYDQTMLRETIEKGGYDTVVNCIGILNRFAEEQPSDAVFLNSYLPHFLADLTKGSDTQIVHLSTDCVFSGKRGGYTEEDFCDGMTFYDRSKALGELRDEKNLTLRQSIVGPDLNPDGIGLMNWFLQQNDAVSGYRGAHWTGLTTLQLAKTVECAAAYRCHGLVNMVPDTSITKYELLALFNRYLRPTPIRIEPDERWIADKSLIRTNWSIPCAIPDYEQMVSELGVFMREHWYLYPHYAWLADAQ